MNNDKCVRCDVCHKYDVEPYEITITKQKNVIYSENVCESCQREIVNFISEKAENEALVRGRELLAHEVGVDYEDSDDDLTDFLLSMSPEDVLKATAQIRKDIQRVLCCDVRVGDNEQ